MQTIIFLHPAITAGISCIRNEDINGADPPGTYKPTVSIALNSFQILIPFVVSKGEEIRPLISFSQTNLILFAESRIDFFKSSEIKVSDLIISDFLTLKDLIIGKLNSLFIKLNALVPLAFTSSSILLTVT